MVGLEQSATVTLMDSAEFGGDIPLKCQHRGLETNYRNRNSCCVRSRSSDYSESSALEHNSQQRRKGVNKATYLQCLSDMMTFTSASQTAVCIREYLAEMEIRFGPKFDPIKALEGLASNVETLKKEMIRMKVMP
jgi:hypothetical protein